MEDCPRVPFRTKRREFEGAGSQYYYCSASLSARVHSIEKGHQEERGGDEKGLLERVKDAGTTTHVGSATERSGELSPGILFLSRKTLY